MKTLGIAGWKNSGKTTLVCALVRELSARGYVVSTIKRAHHNVSVDHPGKDSFKHRQSGAVEVLVTSDKRWALMHEHPHPIRKNLSSMIAKLSPADLVIVEGFKSEPIPKIEVKLGQSKGEPLAPRDDCIIALASDQSMENYPVPVFDINDIQSLSNFVVSHLELRKVINNEKA